MSDTFIWFELVLVWLLMVYVNTVSEAVVRVCVLWAGRAHTLQRSLTLIQGLTCKSKASLTTTNIATSGKMEDQNEGNIFLISNITNER